MTTPAAAATVGRKFRPTPAETGSGLNVELISRYRLNSGSVADDLGGVNGTIVGTWTSTTTDSLIAGVSGQSFYKDGGAAYFTIPANNPAHALGALSFSFYFQPTAGATNMCMCARANSSTIGGFSLERRASNGRLRGWHVGQDGGLRFFANDVNGIPGTNLLVGTAYRITVTMGPGGFKIYLDDSLVTTISENTNAWANGSPWFFGMYTDTTGLPMFGVLDHIRVWNGELTASGVAALEDATSITPPSGEEGIAAGFVNDVNISSHPSVINHLTFEDGTDGPWTGSSFSTWQAAITTVAANVHTGTRSLETTNPIRTDSGAQLQLVLSPTQDLVFLRAYVKWDPDWDLGTAVGNHMGLSIRASSAPSGTKPDGTNFYNATMQISQVNEQNQIVYPVIGTAREYAYHVDQPGNFGDHMFPNQGINPQINPDQWHCLEMMLKANTAGVADGEIKNWVDGQLILHEIGLRFRTVSTLKIDRVWLRNYIHNNTVRQNKIWWDDIVVATEYIGPQGS